MLKSIITGAVAITMRGAWPSFPDTTTGPAATTFAFASRETCCTSINQATAFCNGYYLLFLVDTCNYSSSNYSKGPMDTDTTSVHMIFFRWEVYCLPIVSNYAVFTGSLDGTMFCLCNDNSKDVSSAQICSFIFLWTDRYFRANGENGHGLDVLLLHL